MGGVAADMDRSILRSMKSQRGAALAISLILLVAMTILGVATLNGTRSAEKVSSNAQQKAIVFETAESVMNSITSADDLGTRLLASRYTLLEPDPVPQLTEPGQLSAELDQTNTFGTSVDVSADASIQFCGEYPTPGTGMDADESVVSKIGLQFDIRANSNIANSKAKAAHVTRIEDTGLKLNGRGKCIMPGS